MSSTLTDYLWLDSYLNAICETDDMKKGGLLLEARSALEQRLLSPIAPGSDEDRAIRTAQIDLRLLTAEGIAPPIDRIDDPLQGIPGYLRYGERGRASSNPDSSFRSRGSGSFRPFEDQGSKPNTATLLGVPT
jgi:hypothetical protein